MLSDNTALSSALWFCGQGIKAIPVRQGKNPNFSGWQKLIKIHMFQYTEEFVTKLFHQNPPEDGYQQNVGVLCGYNVVVFDADSPHAITFAEENLPYTTWQVSRGTSDRRHFYYRVPGGHEFYTLKESEYFDFLSNGSQVLAPGSIHPDTNQPYEWYSNEGVPCRKLPPELIPSEYNKIKEFAESTKKTKSKTTIGTRNKLTHDLALKLANQGVSMEEGILTCIDHYRKEFDNTIEPDSDEQIKRTVKSAYEFVYQNPLNVAKVAEAQQLKIKDPEPLRPPKIPRQRYPVEQLGEMLSSLVNVIERDVKAPIEAVANTVLATAATAAQTHAYIAAPHGDKHPLSLLLVTVVNSGERKSVIHKICEQGLIDAEKEMMQEYLKLLKKFRIAQKVYAVEEKKILSDKVLSPEEKNSEIYKLKKPSSPLLPNIVIDNTTAEGLHKTLEGGYPSVGLLSDEGGVMLGGHAHLPENELRIMTLFAKLWDGATIDRHRAGDGSSKIRNRALSVHLMAQSEVADILLRNKMARSQGLLNRMLIAKPPSRVGTRQYQETNVFDEKEVIDFRHALYNLASLPIEYRKTRPGELNRSIIKLSEGAVSNYKMFHDYIEKRCGEDGEYNAVSGFAIRSPELALRLAGVMAMIEQAPTIPSSLDEHYFVRGANLMLWYIQEQLRLTDEALAHSDVKVGEALLEFAKRLPVQASGEIHLIKRDAVQRGPRSVRRDSDLNRAVKFLIDKGQLIANKPGVHLADMDGQIRERRKSWLLVQD